ncbi:MAG TPA: methyltransferase domain-containing protein, partial [Candidatus Wunengus sp. YC61]|uniref:methyltransferase domain-containing protein n=1 Tax=Candidatus Wunengus sp. YC61 TaxID=3367698 RepID=UPI0040296B8D
MNKKFIKYLADPKTGEELRLLSDESKNTDITSGYLVSKSNRYPIIQGVPRFAGYNEALNYSESFDYQWNRWSQIQFDSKNIGKPMAGHTQKMWEQIVNCDNKLIKGKLLIDFGCGPGRFIEIARKKGARVIGIDLSDAVEVAQDKYKNDHDVLIVQGDILKPPFKKEIADGAFSIGVLHHLPYPHLGFKRIIDVVKRSGWLAVSVYGQYGYYTSPVVNFYRRIFKKLWPVFGPYPALLYSYATVYIFRSLARVPIIKYLIY